MFMKKLMISFFLFVFSIPAFSWGLLFDMDKYPGTAEPGYKGFVLYNLLQQAQGKHKKAQLDVCVDLDPQVYYTYIADTQKQIPQRNTQQVAAFLVDITQQSFNTWLDQTRQALQPRRKEFADVLSALPAQVQLNWVNANGPYQDCGRFKQAFIIYGRDTNELVGNEVERGNAHPNNLDGQPWSVTLPASKTLAKEVYYEHLIKINSPKARVFSSVEAPMAEDVALHEVGHLLGLADQYSLRASVRNDMLLNGSEPTNSHLTYSLYKTEGANFFKINSIMRERNGGRFSSDDVEGLVNAVDFVLRHEDASPSKRLQYGWAALGERGYVYIQGVPVRVNAAQKEAFQAWVQKGYKASAQPAFARTAEQQQQQAAEDLAGYISSSANIEEEYNTVNTQIDSLQLELKHAALTPAERKQKQQQLAALTQRKATLQPVYEAVFDQSTRNKVFFGKTIDSNTLALVNQYKKLSPVVADQSSAEPTAPAAAAPVRVLPQNVNVRAASVAATGRTPSIAPVYNPRRQAQPVASASASAAAAEGEKASKQTPSLPQTSAATVQGVPAAQPSVAAPQAPAVKLCDVCGQPVQGTDYYTDSVGRHVHKGGACAYQYFARFHKTDNQSLTSYDEYYFLNQPQAVTVAKADMKKLGITTAGIRSYLKNEHERQKAARTQQQVGKQMQALTQKTLEQKCSSYHVVTKADLNAYLKDNNAVLNTATLKRKAGQKLGKKEEKILNAYYALLADYQTTQFCQNLAQQ